MNVAADGMSRVRASLAEKKKKSREKFTTEIRDDKNSDWRHEAQRFFFIRTLSLFWFFLVRRRRRHQIILWIPQIRNLYYAVILLSNTKYDQTYQFINKKIRDWN